MTSEIDTPLPPVDEMLRERYGSDEVLDLAAAVTPVIAQALAHRTHRAYTSAPVEERDLRAAIAAGQAAPSSSHLQNWSVIAVRDPAQKARLNGLCGGQAQIDAAPLLLVWLADLSRNKAISDQAGAEGAVFDYTEALFMGIIDATIAAQNATLALESLGYGTCYIGGARNHMAALAKELDLPDLVMPVFAMTVGRPDPSVVTDIKPRLPQSAVLMEGGYTATEPSALVAYDAAMVAFQAKQGMGQHGWTSTVARRFEATSNLHGRENTMPYLVAAKFGML